MGTNIGNVAIEVTDLERSETFYVEVIGLEVLNRIETPDVREVIVGHPDTGSRLMLARHTESDGPIRPGGIWKVFVETDDVHALYESAVAAGAVAVDPPKRLDQFPVTIAFVQDPDGYLLELGQLHR